MTSKLEQLRAVTTVVDDFAFDGARAALVEDLALDRAWRLLAGRGPAPAVVGFGGPRAALVVVGFAAPVGPLLVVAVTTPLVVVGLAARVGASVRSAA